MNDDRRTEQEQLEQLFSLLTGFDRSELARLTAMASEGLDPFADRERFVRNLARALAEAVRLKNTDQRFGDALAPVVSRGVHETVQRDAESFGRALAPAMGPAIRQAVRQAVDSAVGSLEHALSAGVSPKSWSWRFQAWRSGKSFAEVVFLKTLAYRVEHAFLFHRDGGLPLSHASSPEARRQPPELLSGMITALQDFTADVFSTERTDSLSHAKVGDFDVLVEHGQHVLLAAVVRGRPPLELRDRLREVLEEVQLSWPMQIAAFDGDAAPFEDTRPLLESCLQRQALRPQRKRVPRLALAISAAIVFVAFSIAWLVIDGRRATAWNRYIERLNATPGVVVVSQERDGAGGRIRGLRDPIVGDLSSLRTECIGAAPVDASWNSFEALDESVLQQRIDRWLATAPLGEGETVELQVESGALFARGEANHAFHVALAANTPGTLRLDASELVDSDRQAFDAAYAALGTVSVRVGPGPHVSAVDLENAIEPTQTLVERGRRLGRMIRLSVTFSGGSPEQQELWRREIQSLLSARAGVHGLERQLETTPDQPEEPLRAVLHANWIAD